MENKELIADRLKTFLKIEPEIITPHESLTKKQAEQVFKDNRIVVHNELGVTVLSVETVNKILKHKGFDTSTIIKFISYLYKKSILIESQTEKEFEGQSHKIHTNIQFWHNTLNKFKIKNNETQKFDNYIIRFTVTEQYAGKKKKKGSIGERTLHSTNISSIKLEKTNDGMRQHQQSLSATFPSDKILAHYLEIVKDFVKFSK